MTKLPKALEQRIEQMAEKYVKKTAYTFHPEIQDKIKKVYERFGGNCALEVLERAEKLAEALEDTVDSGYDQAGHCEQALADWQSFIGDKNEDT